MIDLDRQGHLNFNNLKNFFHDSGLLPYDAEIISLLRRIDRDDDAVILVEELEKFFGLFFGPEIRQERDEIRRHTMTKKEDLKRENPGRKIVISKIALLKSEKKKKQMIYEKMVDSKKREQLQEESSTDETGKFGMRVSEEQSINEDFLVESAQLGRTRLRNQAHFVQGDVVHENFGRDDSQKNHLLFDQAAPSTPTLAPRHLQMINSRKNRHQGAPYYHDRDSTPARNSKISFQEASGDFGKENFEKEQGLLTPSGNHQNHFKGDRAVNEEEPSSRFRKSSHRNSNEVRKSPLTSNYIKQHRDSIARNESDLGRGKGVTVPRSPSRKAFERSKKRLRQSRASPSRLLRGSYQKNVNSELKTQGNERDHVQPNKLPQRGSEPGLKVGGQFNQGQKHLLNNSNQRTSLAYSRARQELESSHNVRE